MATCHMKETLDEAVWGGSNLNTGEVLLRKDNLNSYGSMGRSQFERLRFCEEEAAT